LCLCVFVLFSSLWVGVFCFLNPSFFLFHVLCVFSLTCVFHKGLVLFSSCTVVVTRSPFFLQFFTHTGLSPHTAHSSVLPFFRLLPFPPNIFPLPNAPPSTYCFFTLSKTSFPFVSLVTHSDFWTPAPQFCTSMPHVCDRLVSCVVTFCMVFSAFTPNRTRRVHPPH